MGENPQRKMVKIDVVETSGVDHPAHLTEGWVVMKAADAAEVDALFGTPSTKEPVVAEITQEQYDAAVAKATEAEAKLAEAVKKAEKAENDLAEAVAKAAQPQETDEEKMLKAMPEALRLRLEKAEADAKTQREEFAKERDARLDAEAVREAQSMFKAIAIDHGAVAPALRKFAAENAEAAQKITETLKAAEAQLESAGLFQELGKNSDNQPATAMDKINVIAKALRDADPTLGESEAIAKAVDQNPSIFTDYMKGQ